MRIVPSAFLFIQVMLVCLMSGVKCGFDDKKFETDLVVLDNKEFTFHKQKLSWSEAASLCRSLGSYLAILDSSLLVNQINKAIGKFTNQNDSETLWIGGRYKSGKWTWKSTGEVIHGSDSFSKWGDGTEINYSCLLFSRNKSSTFWFLPQDCSIRHSFICEKGLKVKLSVENELQDRGHKYSLYQAPLTWDQAVSVCRDNGSYLVVVSNLQEAKLLSTFLASSTLSLKKVWLGGRLDDLSWQWVGTGDVIPSRSQAGGYPPWKQEYNPDSSSHLCLQMDGHKAQEPLFQVANCTSAESFLCEQVTSQENLDKNSYSLHGCEFIIFNRKLSWSSAAKACEAENGHLAAIPNMETLEYVSDGMKNSWESLTSLWVGGYQATDNVWQWLPSNTSLANATDPTTRYPPWNKSPTPVGGDCVSIEQGADGKKEFVQKDCGYSQTFVCMRDESETGPIFKVVVIGDRSFTIHEKPETWDKAIDICKQEDAHLAVLGDIDEVLFLNSTSSVQKLWLGGRFVKGAWQWLQLGEKIPMDMDDEGFPPWNPLARRPKNKADCLLLDMHKTNDVRFMAAPCITTLSFICEKIPKIQDKRVHDGRAYIVYSERVPWLEAATLCRSKGYHLAMASDLVQSRFLASLTREYYELWLGGVLRDGIWEWEHTGEEILSTPERNGYPPWISVPTLPGHNCLSINRGGSGAPVFVDTQCDIAQRFICETGTADISFLLEPRVVEYESRVYTFYPQRLTWREAAEECQEVGGSLVTLTNTDMVKFIAHESHNIPDVWVGGHIVDDEWHWISSGEIIPPRKEGREFPPWARPKHRGGHDCLILNRHNPNRPILVDLPCNRTQPFVCEKADNNTVKLVETLKLPDREFIFVENRENFMNAMKVCQSLNGYLATVNSADLTEVVDNHGKKFGGVWVGAQKDSNSIVRWMHTGQPIADIGMRSMVMWDEDDEIQVGNDYKTNERIFGVLADIPDFVAEAPMGSHHRSKPPQQESETNWNALTEDIAEIKISNPSSLPSHKAPAIQSDLVTPKLLLEGIIELSKENGKEDAFSITNAHKLEQTPTEPVTIFVQVSSEDKLASIQQNTTLTSDIPSLRLSSHTLESEQLNVEIEEKAGTAIPSPGNRFDYDSPLTTTESIKTETITTLQTEILATACMKLDSKGELVEVPCDTMQSFVCERRTNETQPNVKFFSFHGRLYGFSMQKVTWDKAANICSRNNSYLAIVTSSEEASFIANVSQEFQDLWIGGHYNEGTKQWQWVHTGVNISTTQDEEGFPKWYNVPSQPGYNCLNVYKESPGEATFIDRECHSLHGFVCEDITFTTDDGEDISEAKNVTYEFHGRSVVLHYEKVSWDEAVEHCVSNSTLLLTVQTQLDLEVFRTVSPAFHDVWVGASVRGKNWYWDKTYTLITNIVISGNELTFMQEDNSTDRSPLSAWMNNFTRKDYNCASVYRDSDQSVHLVDLPCKSRHSFACEETYSSKIEFDGRKYTFYVQRLTWSEASEFCNRKGQYLAVVDHPGEATFIADVGRAFREVWVGGRMANGNKVGWVWDHTGQGVRPDLGTDRFWPWLNSQPQSQSENQCLSVFRPEGRNEMFADEDCSRTLSFVCEDAGVNDVPTVKAEYFHNRPYTFHATLSTWEEAEEACRSNGSYLVILNSEEEAKFISQNPFGFHDIWVGSKWNPKKGHWEWIHTGEIFKMEEKSSNISNGAVNNKRPDHDCLNIYRDSFQKYVYIDRKCSEKHSFVCEEGGRIDVTFTKMYTFENKRYKVYSKAVTWEEASDMCLSSGQYLATIYSSRLLDFIERNVSKAFHDLWVDGHYGGIHWKWARRGKVIPNKLRRGTSAKSQLWIHNPTRPEHNCLNLYHPTSNRILFLDRKCNETFGFICESISPSSSKIETRVLKGRQYTFYNMKVDWNKANNICKSNGSYLAVLKTPDEAALITKIGREFLNLWIGARVTDEGRIWEHTEESVPNATDVYPYLPTQLTHNMDCFIIGRGQDGNAYLNDTLCNSTHNFVCEEQGDNGDTYMETYTFNNQQYKLSTRKTSWSQAEQLCHISGSHLAILNTKEEAEFFNNVSRKFHDLWIGGKQEDGKWIWKYTNKHIIPENSSTGTYETQFVNSSVKPEEDMCLNLYRETNTDSYLIGRPCKEEYGFICEGTPVGPTPVSQIADFNGRKYRLHNQLATWNDAVEICSSEGGYLANVEDLEEAKNIIGVDKQFHDLWIGGNFCEDHWIWQSIGEHISSVVDNTTLFPPWVNSSTRPGYECLNLYSANSEPKFVDQKCNEMHGFVCEEVGLKDDMKVVSKFSGHRYVFVAKRVKWYVALESCRAMRGYLAVISDIKELKFIVDGSRDFHDLWVGGHLAKGKWEWEHTGTQILTPTIDVNSSSNETNVTKKQTLPWLRLPVNPEQQCLNVYRDNKNKPFLVDKKCTDLHAFICEDVPETILSSRQMKYLKNRRYELSQDKVSWPEASRLCSLLGGYLAIIDNAEEASFLASASKDLPDPWIGAVRKHDGSWMWAHTEQELTLNSSFVPPFVRAEPHPLYECANLYRDSFNKPMMIDRRCGHRFGFVCEDTNEPEAAIEMLQYRGHYYAFISKMATWEEASRICNKNGSYLAIIESLEEAQFIVNVSRNIHDVWVGGWYNKNMWEWRHTGQEIGSRLAGVSPPWIHNPTRLHHNCLNIFRDSNNAPHFVDRKCSEKHVFICEEVDGSSKPHQEKFQYNGRTYLFSSEKVTWDEASEMCKHAGSYLAQVESREEALFIVKAGRDFHDLWIGGHLGQEIWEWDHTGQDIPEDSGPGSFPRWIRVNSRLDHDCLNIFRNNNLEPFFVDRKCNETHGYVCEEADSTKGDEDATETLTLDGHLFTFHTQRVTWNEAFDICAKNDSTLPIVTNKNVAQFLISKVYHDIWIGGQFEDTHWAWKPKNRPIAPISRKDEFSTWIRTLPRMEHDCLVLYRDSENRPVFLDRRCEEKHVFVCQKYNIVGTETEILEYGDRIFTFVKRPEEWGDAYDICNQNSSYLPMVADENIQKFLANKISSVPEIWIGGHKSKEHWRWELLGETIPASKTDSSFPVWLDERVHSDHECLVLNIETNGQPKFSSCECTSEKPFVCEHGCPILKNVKRGKWSRPECSTRVSLHNETCSLTCKFGFELWGTKELICGRDGWSGVPPLCITTDRLANAFVERVNSSISELLDHNDTQIRHTALLFVISTTKKLGGDNFYNIVELIKSVVAAIRLSPSTLSAGVVTYGERWQVNIPLNVSDVCKFLELANLLTDNSADEVNLRGALSFTYDYITSIGYSEQTVLVLVTNGNSSTDESEIVEKLKAGGHKLLTIGIGDDIRPETIEKIASLSSENKPKVPNFFSVSDDETYSSFVIYLNDTYLYNGDITCCMTLRNPAHGEWDPPSCTQAPGSLKNSSCSMSCELGYELVGNPSLTCTEEGWSGPLGKGQIPLCNSAEVTARSMFDSMDDTFAMLEKVGILFLLDHSTSMSAADYQKQMAFVKMIVSKFSLSKSRTAGLITFNTQAQVMIPLNTSETCAFMMGLENVKFQGGGTSFSAALQAAENEINANAVHSTTLLFLMTDGRSHGNSKTIADRLKSDGNIIFTFGVGGYKRKQLESLASRGPNNKPNFFGVTDFDALKNAFSFLNTSYLKSSEKHCCTRLRSQISGIWSPSHCSTFPSEEHDECSISCDKGYELFGSNKLTCTSEGWSGIMASCFAKADIMANLIRAHIRSRLSNIKTPGALLFVLEQTERTLHEHFTIMSEFVKQIVTMFSLSKNQTGGLIVGYKTGAETEVTLDTENTCDFIKYLNAAKFHKGSPSLGRAFKLVKKTTKAYGLTDNILIILLTDRNHVSRTSQSLARKLKDSGKPLFIIGIDNREARSDLLIMSESGYFSNNTVPDGLMILDSYDTLEAITDLLSMPEKLTAWYKTTGYVPPNC